MALEDQEHLLKPRSAGSSHALRWPHSHSGSGNEASDEIVVEGRPVPPYVRWQGHNWPPRGLREPEAARYVGVSPSQFRTWVSTGVMPGPKKVGGVVVWDRQKLDIAFEDLPERDCREEHDVWSCVAT